MVDKEKDYMLIVRVTPEQEQLLRDNGVKIEYREDDLIWDSLMTKPRLFYLAQATLEFFVDNKFFDKYVDNCARCLLEDDSKFDKYIDELFEEYKLNYVDQLGISYDESYDFISNHFKGYAARHPEFYSKKVNLDKKFGPEF